jgi:hypothetical protein
MTAMPPIAPTSEPGELQALTGRRPQRSGQRGTPRFHLPVAGTADDAQGAGRERTGRADMRRPGRGTADAGPDGAPGSTPDSMVIPGTGPVARPEAGRAPLSPDMAQAANLPAQVSQWETVPTSGPDGSTAGSSDGAVGPGVAARLPGGTAAAGRGGVRTGAEPAGRMESEGGSGPAREAVESLPGWVTPQPQPSDGHSDARPGHASSAGQTTGEQGAGPGAAATGDMATGDMAAGLPGRPPAGAPSKLAARREGPASPSVGLPAFRLEPTGGPATGRAVSAPTVGPREAAPEPWQPADILVAQGGAELGGLDVTIAAATTDLRDRFRAATDELQAELSAIGADVDAIRVELRSDLADGGSEPGGESAQDRAAQALPGDESAGRADGNRAGWSWAEEGRAETGRTAAAGADSGGGTSDATARHETIDPDADASDADTGEAGRDAGGQAGAGQAGADGREVERLRLLLGPAGPDSRAGSAGAGPLSPGGTPRIDRYA